MSDDDAKKIEEALARRAAKREAKDGGEKKQFLADLEALEKLEEEFGFGTVAAVKVDFVPGHPTRAFLRTPKSSEYRRYRDLVGQATKTKSTKGLSEAQDQLAKSVWVYPAEQEAKDAMLEQFPGLLGNILLSALKLAEGKAEEEGKD